MAFPSRHQLLKVDPVRRILVLLRRDDEHRFLDTPPDCNELVVGEIRGEEIVIATKGKFSKEDTITEKTYGCLPAAVKESSGQERLRTQQPPASANGRLS